MARKTIYQQNKELCSELEQLKQENKVEEHWVGMPEYDNVKQPEPLIVVTFKFSSQEDFDEFNMLLKKHVYKTKKVFDGMQRKTSKTAWYPLRKKARIYIYD